jgi:putative ABC transport system permease protein
MLTEVIHQAFATMRSHRRWAALTMFGIVWGTASVILLVGWGVGSHRMTDQGMQKVGKNLVITWAGRIGEEVSPADERRTVRFDLDDVKALRQSARFVEHLSGENFAFAHVRYGSTGRIVDVRGIEPEMKELRGVDTAAGRFISRDDVRFRRRVAVIGHTARERLLGPRPAVGEHITVNGRSFKIIGLLDRVGAQLSRNRTLIDEQVWMPITSLMTLLGNEHVDDMIMRPFRRDQNAAIKKEVRSILARRVRVSPTDEEAVFVISMIDFLSGFDQVHRFMNNFLFMLAVGTLSIGGIGVMNMMLVSVNERRREIGLRLAVGAQRRHVVGQFLIETLVITLTGGAIGLVFGLAGCALLGAVPGELVPRPVIVPEIVVAAIVTTVVVGLVSGIGPAWRAAAVDPAESLRAE